ncbi:hypothetical protein Syn33_214 [Prochlorococcus phage Syn33]|uniref:Uncharacterized protein n=1 Tax=Prochlorococcus phage Syn33 TaxID=444878 RepID=E3SRA0_9CAUD|nr:hypothetical protein Syn33_214 [Prochlorococcus phage Syn33]ADO99570.1 hypothetical protein Syn33_214 [Prochlorococcus phage Syn33]
MISKDTPSKLAEIIRDTWPQLYWLKDLKKETKNDYNNTKSTNKGVV